MEKSFVSIELSEDEALVLFEWLAAREDARSDDTVIDAETHVFWTVEAQLQTTLTQIFDPDYRVQVQLARKRIEQANQDGAEANK